MTIFGKSGIVRDRSGVTKPEKNEISIQCAGQILWYLEGNKIPTIESMKTRLLDQASPLFKLLEPDRFFDSEILLDRLRLIFPIPKEKRKEKWNITVGDIPIPVPGIFTDAGINFPKLRFAVHCITTILKAFQWKINKIFESKFIEMLIPKGEYIFSWYVTDWIKESYKRNTGFLPQ